jgi:hypothetical protein
MIILGKSRVVATTVALALASSLSLTLAASASAQTADKPAAAKPAAPAAAAPAAAKPADAKAPAPAAAAAKPADAKALFASGEKKFKASDYAGALADFEASQTAKADPATERYIALSHDNLQHYPEAVAAYEKFIAANPPKLKDQVEEAKKRVEAIKVLPAKVKVETTPAGASVVIDTAQTPYEKVTPVEIDLPPGKHTLLIGAEGYENTTKEIEVTFAEKRDVKADLVKKEAPPPPPPPVAAETPAPAPPPPPPPPEPRSKVPAYVTGAVAIVAAGVGTGFGLKALSQSNDFDKHPTTKKADDGENNALVADMMFGIAITFGVTSAVLFLSNDTPASSAKAAPQPKVAESKRDAKKKVTVIPAPYVTPTGGGVGTLIQF